MMTSADNRPFCLYLHVPFCRSICSYCDFCHVVYTEKAADRWLEAVAAEIQRKGIRQDLKTIYIGGGTPVCLSGEQLERLLGMLDPYRGSCIEYTVEVNPESVNERKAAILASHGVSRVSMGMQTADSRLLKLLGRRHTAEDTVKAAGIIRRAGIGNLSLDLMYSLPSQTMESFASSVREALKIGPEHISLYSLTIEENTVFGRKGYRQLDDDTEADMYEYAAAALKEAGYRQYEISNFCLEGRESVHNTAYWDYMDFYGISCGASGKENHVRYDKPRSLAAYIRDPFSAEQTFLSAEDEQFEMIMMGLRLKRGMREDLYEERFGESVSVRYGAVIAGLKEKELITEENGYLLCTDKGFPLLNEVLIAFLK